MRKTKRKSSVPSSLYFLSLRKGGRTILSSFLSSFLERLSSSICSEVEGKGLTAYRSFDPEPVSEEKKKEKGRGRGRKWLSLNAVSLALRWSTSPRRRRKGGGGRERRKILQSRLRSHLPYLGGRRRRGRGRLSQLLLYFFVNLSLAFFSSIACPERASNLREKKRRMEGRGKRRRRRGGEKKGEDN